MNDAPRIPGEMPGPATSSAAIEKHQERRHDQSPDQLDENTSRCPSWSKTSGLGGTESSHGATGRGRAARSSQAGGFARGFGNSAYPDAKFPRYATGPAHHPAELERNADASASPAGDSASYSRYAYLDRLSHVPGIRESAGFPPAADFPLEADAAIAPWRRAGVLVSAAIVALGAVVGLAFFARPAVSQIEHRSLTAFPTLEAGGFLDGSFFEGVSLWYSDTYPLREPLVAAGQAVDGLFGIQPQVQLVGGNVRADQLPVVDGGTTGEGAQDTNGQHDDQAAAEKAPATVPAQAFDALADGPIGDLSERYQSVEIQDSIMAGLYIKDGAAYNIYYFVQEAVERYAAAISTAAERLDGQARVFSLLVPNSSGAMLDYDELESLGGTDQREALRYFYSLYDPRVYPVFIYDTLREHNDEYLYYRTDHHWTTIGAYYAYLEYCRVAGLEPIALEAREHWVFEPFLGSYYTELGLPEMAANPDVVDAFVPIGTNDMLYWVAPDEIYEGEVITDTSMNSEQGKSDCFINGDKPLNRIDNPQITDGSSVLVVKDSFGCFFVPFLVDHYQTVWIIDFRTYWDNIVDFVIEQGIQDVIFLNNMTLAGSDPVSWMLTEMV